MDTSIRNLITSMIVFSYICHKDPRGLKKIMEEYLKIEKDPESIEHIKILMESVDIGISSENSTNIQQEEQGENLELAQLAKELFDDEHSDKEKS